MFVQRLMWCLLFLCLFRGLHSGSVIVFEKTPREVKAPFSQTMTLRCSLRETMSSPFDGIAIGRRDVSQTQENIRLVNSLVVVRNSTDEHVAMVAANNPPKVMADFENIQVDGDADGNDKEYGYINMTWTDPTPDLSGTYKCEINAMNNMGRTIVFSTSLEVKVEQPELKDLVNHILELDGEQKKTKHTIDKLTKELHDTKQASADIKMILAEERKQTKNLTTELRDVKDQLGYLQENVNQGNKLTENHINRIQNKTDDLESYMTREIDNLRQLETNLTNNLDISVNQVLETNITLNMRNDINKLTGDMMTGKEHMTTMQNELGTLSSDLLSKKVQLNQLVNDLRSLDTKSSSNVNLISQMTSKTNDIQRNVDRSTHIESGSISCGGSLGPSWKAGGYEYLYKVITRSFSKSYVRNPKVLITGVTDLKDKTNLSGYWLRVTDIHSTNFTLRCDIYNGVEVTWLKVAWISFPNL